MRKSIKTVDFRSTRVLDGFWRQKQDMARTVSAKAVYDRFKDTGRIDAFKCSWREGMPNRPHFFWDSDVAKWIEGVAYMLHDGPLPELEACCDAIIEDLVKNQGADGYFNIYFTVVEPERRFTDRDKHELYCAGHLMEAAVAYFEATGKRALLDAMCRYADYIEKRFMLDRDTSFVTPGHEEIELALFRLYECTGEYRYFKLAEFFLNQRGVAPDPTLSPSTAHGYNQTHLPIREQTTAEGHAVRAVYLYSAMADLARYTNDEALIRACEKIFANITERRMYITGGIGSSSCGEAFTVDYDLPNILAYSESCAAIGLIFFANRMLTLTPDSRYSDVIERALYNGFLSSTSLDGRSFFYENPLALLPYLSEKDKTSTHNRIRYPRHTRLEVFGCSCCPPNIVRFIPSVANLLYGDDGETLFVHQFMASETTIERAGKRVTVRQTTDYPSSGRVRISVSGADVRLAVRIPGWCDSYTGPTKLGYAYLDLADGESVDFDFEMKPQLVVARPEVFFNGGRLAVQRGPVVYCTEEVDNGKNLRDIRIDSTAKIECAEPDALGVPTLVTDGFRSNTDESTPLYRTLDGALTPVKVKLIPYYAFANRGVSEMQVWHIYK